MATIDTLQAIYSGRIPSDATAALAVLDQSPLAPIDPEQKAVLRAAVMNHLGEQIDDLKAAFVATTANAQPIATEHRQTGGQIVAVRRSGEVEPATTVRSPKLQRAVSEVRVQELYDQMAKAPDIPHHFVDDGCMFRAHVVAKRLEDAGVFSEKIIRQTTGGDLKINSDKAAIGFTLAMFHIATCLYVKTANGRVERRVIDPSLCDGPATPEAWASRMEAVGGAPCVTSYMPRFCLMPYDQEAPPSTWEQRDLDDAMRWNEEYGEVQKYMLENDFYAHLKELVEHPPGGRP